MEGTLPERTGGSEPRCAAGGAAAAAPALDRFLEQSWGHPNLPCKPRVCTSVHMVSAHAVLLGLANKAEPTCLGLGLALRDEDGDSMKGMGTA